MACPKLGQIAQYISFFRMGISEAVGFFCTVAAGCKRLFFFVDTVPEVAGVTSITLHFGVVAVGIGSRRICLVNLAFCQTDGLTILTAVALRILG